MAGLFLFLYIPLSPGLKGEKEMGIFVVSVTRHSDERDSAIDGQRDILKQHACMFVRILVCTHSCLFVRRLVRRLAGMFAGMHVCMLQKANWWGEKLGMRILDLPAYLLGFGWSVSV